MNGNNNTPFQKRKTAYMLGIVVLAGVVLSAYGLSSSRTSANIIVPTKKTVALVNKVEGKALNQPVSERHKVVIDAGHGGKDPGAEGVSGSLERDYTLAISQKVFDLLQQDPEFEPYMTRRDDTFVELVDRARIANDLNADTFISIHGNTYTDPKISGTETYYYDEGSIPLAAEVHKQLVKATGFNDRGVKKEGWQVLKQNNNPSILLEVGFLTNPSEEASMLSEQQKDKVAAAIVKGIQSYFSMKID
ncbi:N-acetylmuramoyl-L-alanine amidase family protein [Cohnella abietis]|uniref:MurNAc-LAA domain-containing protein n=1 Tax=Cohnella abietis TaxID=2507935 RepID=A0A3T1D8C1_9BACL|nr:N-acetylmuramoyl-L-alanine amidase [Cohnella abietis]BBI34341.1 hypothetical protein KCTCHS21_37400 [Cohnella abietis]